jgi:hypothetical protein
VILDLAVELFITTDLQDLIVAQQELLLVIIWKLRLQGGMGVLIQLEGGRMRHIKQPL